jgi:predicted lipoprotein with Yx(FWY)xxD motif
MNRLIVSALLAGGLAASAFAPALAEDYASGAIKTMDSAKGEILTDAKGMALYTFDKDAAGVSNCYDDCAMKWPPAVAAAGAMASDEFTMVARKDGSQQWAFKGMPLYLWQGDKKPGDVSGDGMGGVWHLARE